MGSDDVTMVEVPGGNFSMGTTEQQVDEWFVKHADNVIGGYYAQDQIPQIRIYLDTFLIDQLEVTNVRYRRCVASGICRPSYLTNLSREPNGYATDTRYDEYPAIVLWDDADTYCQWVGKRLPSEAEWEKAARGTDGRWYPWGSEWDASRATNSLELNDLKPSGSYPLGASPYGVLDMVGNAIEWTAEAYAPYPGQTNQEVFPSFAGEQRVARGKVDGPGATTFRAALRPDGPGWDITGFRCAHGPNQVWRTQVVSTSLSVVPTPAMVDLSEMAYVPAGAFFMGSDEVSSYSQPSRVVYLDAYYIDRYEVTVKQFVEFLNAIGGHMYTCNSRICTALTEQAGPAVPGLEFSAGQYRVKPGTESWAVDNVTWDGASAYCMWKGKQLPTESQWEKAARGTDGRMYPWGSEWHFDWAGLDSFPRIVGAHPYDRSPYGVMDMLGNADEWVQDWFASDYYIRAPYTNPVNEKPSDSGHVTRGPAGRIAENGLSIRLPGVSVSFRCAYTPH